MDFCKKQRIKRIIVEPGKPMIKKYIEQLKAGGSLRVDEAEGCLRDILEHDVPDRQIADLLVLLSEKGESAEEILGFSRALLARTVSVSLPSHAIDVCGTGGSGLDRFNVSTTAAFYCYGQTASIQAGFGLSKALFQQGLVQKKYHEYKWLSRERG